MLDAIIWNVSGCTGLLKWFQPPKLACLNFPHLQGKKKEKERINDMILTLL